MYERSAIVLERCFEKLFRFNQENNLKQNYESFIEIIGQIKEYQKISLEEENVIKKFDDIALTIEEIQSKQTKLHESNIELENERNKLFNDLGENPNKIDSELHTIEKTVNINNEKLKELREQYVEALVIFIERQKERNKYARLRRKAESEYINNIEIANKSFENIEVKNVQALRRFKEIEKEQYEQKIIEAMIRNGKNEKIPFNNQVIGKAVKVRIDIAEKEAEIYVSIYERMKKILAELQNENIKIAKSEKLLRDASVKLNFLTAKKEYIVSFLDNERLTVIKGKNVHKKLMEEACENFELDIKQIDNLYELILKETTGKSTKKAYNELYNKTYLRDIEQKEKNFEQEITSLKVNMGTFINSNYWRIEGIKNVYNVFQEEISEKFGKDLTEYQIDEIDEIDEINIDLDIDLEEQEHEKKHNDNEISENEYEQKEYKFDEKNYYDDEEEYNDEIYDDEYDEDEYEEEYDEYEEEYDDDEDDEYDHEDDDGYDDYDYEEDDDEYDDYDYEDENEDDDYDDEDENDEYDEYDYDYDEDDFLEEKIDRIIKRSKNNRRSRNNSKKDKGLLNKFFGKKE